MNLVDTSGWIEFFFEGPNAAFFANPIEAVEELIVPTICLYEVFKKVHCVADKARALQAVAQMRQGQLIVLSEKIAIDASLLSMEYALPMADSLIYATAKAHDAVVWTQDAHFRDLPRVHFRETKIESPKRGSKPCR